MDPVRIRPLRSGESAACGRILRSLPDWFGIEDAIRHYVAEIEGLETQVAEAGDRVTGFLSLKPHNAHAAEIYVMAVAPDLHRAGIGRALVEHAARSLRTRSFEYLQVKTLGPSRESAGYAGTRRFYERLGFRPLEENNLWGEANPCLVMVKHLGPASIPPIRCRTYIDAAPQRVYEMLATGSGWDAWFTQGTEVDARPGGTICFRWVDWAVDRYTTEARGPVLEAEPPHRFVFQWTPGDSTTTIEFDLQALGPGTVLEVRESGHTGSRRDLEALAECAGGWGEALALLKMYLEHGVTYGPVPREGE